MYLSTVRNLQLICALILSLISARANGQSLSEVDSLVANIQENIKEVDAATTIPVLNDCIEILSKADGFFISFFFFN